MYLIKNLIFQRAVYEIKWEAGEGENTQTTKHLEQSKRSHVI